MLEAQFDSGAGPSAASGAEALMISEAAAGIHVVAAMPEKRRGRGCRVCLGEHDGEIHAATLRIRSWFRDQVTMTLKAM